jgi:hypothetical protein
MGAKNKVIAGDYQGKQVTQFLGLVSIMTGFGKSEVLNKTTVEEYEIVDESTRKSASSAIGRGLAGSLILGPVGMLAGLSAKSKGTHVVAIQFKDGKKSLIEIDDKIYSALVKSLF